MPSWVDRLLYINFVWVNFAHPTLNRVFWYTLSGGYPWLGNEHPEQWSSRTGRRHGPKVNKLICGINLCHLFFCWWRKWQLNKKHTFRFANTYEDAGIDVTVNTKDPLDALSTYIAEHLRWLEFIGRLSMVGSKTRDTVRTQVTKQILSEITTPYVFTLSKTSSCHMIWRNVLKTFLILLLHQLTLPTLWHPCSML